MRKLCLAVLMIMGALGFLFLSSQPAEASTWTAVQGAKNINYFAADLVGATHGWVGGATFVPPGQVGFEDTAIIGRTTSAGANWQYSTSHETGNVSVGWNFRTATTVDFIDTLRGWAALSDGTIISTSDGGVTWKLQAEGSFEFRDNNWGYSSLAMADAAHGCAVGGWVGFIGITYPRIVYTENGSDWKEADYPKPENSSLESVFMVDAEYGWAVGFAGPSDQTPLILVTHDGGATWTRQVHGLPSTGIDLHGVWFADRQHGWAVGDFGAIFVTVDGGATWWSQPSGTTAALLDVNFAPSGVGWGVGEKGVILETTRRGLPWVLQTTGTSATLRSVTSAGAAAWAVGDEGVILTAAVPATDPSGPGFSDIGSSPYETAIESLAVAGIAGGFLDGTYRPDATLNRAQFAKLIVGALGIVPGAATPTQFTDLGSPNANGYPHKYVQTAFDNGITLGINAAGTLFAPWNPIRRDQAVSMIVRGAKSLLTGTLEGPPPGTPSLFTGVGEPHGENLRIADYNGLLSGLIGMGAAWSVTATATRGEVAQMLYNLRLK
ncbi:MAG: hypothetical protein A2133_10115 [Actinobacteria bacterium RBG_16_64_13]|nr:MAG: hypothetical protein A2133_10115 [Actinobacteria bacterium RBG_16_64_13]